MTLSKPTIYPTLVIGIGGTGTNVVRHVKARLLKEFGKGAGDELPELFQVLAVDTEPRVNPAGSQPLYDHEFAFMGQFSATRFVQNRAMHSPYLDWWQWDDSEMNLGYISNGAKQLRPVGRLCFFRNYEKFQSTVRSKLRMIQRVNAIAAAEERQYPVQTAMKMIYIVSSICGGTGAGMLVDAVRCVRDYVGENAKIIGVLAMPSVFVDEIQSSLQMRRIHANAYAVLKELDYFQKNTTAEQQLYPNEDHLIPGTAVKPFDQVFLVEMSDDTGTSLTDKSSVEKMMAHFIQLTNLSDASHHILGMDANVQEMAYSAFGVSALVLPRDNIDAMFRVQARHAVLAELVKARARPSLNIDARIAKCLANMQLTNDERTKASVEEVGREFQAGGSIWKTVQRDLNDEIGKAIGQSGWKATADALASYIELLGERRQSADHSRGDVSRGFSIVEWGRPVPERIKEKNSVVHFSESILNPKGARLYEKKVASVDAYKEWQKALFSLSEQVVNLCSRYVERIRQYLAAAGALQQQSEEMHQEIQQNFERRGSEGVAKTSFFYDLEAPAIGDADMELLQSWLQGSLTEDRITIQEQVTDSGRTVKTQIKEAWSTLVLRRLQQDLLADMLQYSGGERFDARKLEGLLDQYAEFAEWCHAADRAFDIRKIYGSRADRKDGAQPRPNNRADQLHKRAGLHTDIDLDGHNYAGANPEPLRVVTAYLPVDDPDDDYSITLRENSKFKAISSRDRNRMDACYIKHGIPGSHIRGLVSLYQAYWGDTTVELHPHAATSIDPRRLHLNRDWVKTFPELYPDRLDSRAADRKRKFEMEDVAHRPVKPSTDDKSSSRRSGA